MKSSPGSISTRVYAVQYLAQDYLMSQRGETRA